MSKVKSALEDRLIQQGKAHSDAVEQVEQDFAYSKAGRQMCSNCSGIEHDSCTYYLFMWVPIGQESLGSRQASVLAFIRSFVRHNHYPPTIREIVLGCSLSTNSLAVYHLDRLEEKGYLTRTPTIARGIVLVEANPGEPNAKGPPFHSLIPLPDRQTETE